MKNSSFRWLGINPIRNTRFRESFTTTSYLNAAAANFFYATFLCCISFLFVNGQSPGGAGAPRLWLKANQGVYSNAGTTLATNGVAVTQWNDYSGSASNLSQSTVAEKPTFSNGVVANSRFNYNPTVSFGNNHLRTNLGGTGIFPKVTTYNHINIYAVYHDLDASDFDILYYQGVDGFDRVSQTFNYNSNTRIDFDITTGNRVEASTATDIPTVTTNIVSFNNGITATYGNASNRYQAVMVNGKEVGSRAAFSAYTGADTEFYLGDNENPGSATAERDKPFTGYLSEFIVFQNSLDAAQRNRIESYLALKYGKTLDNSAGGTDGDYLSSANTTIWDADANSAYHKQVIGIGRDDNTALLQKQSRTPDDSSRIFLSSLQTNNASNGGSFSADGSFVIAGSNAAEMFNAGSTEYPTGQGIVARIGREWKLTNTNFTGTFSLDLLGKFTTPNAAHLRILIDTDGDFTNATVHNPTINVSGSRITITNLDNTMIPSGATRYLTLASINAASALPVTFTAFNVVAEGSTVQLTWQTGAEQNSDFFYVERSADGAAWQQLGRVKAAGNSTQLLRYAYTDLSPNATTLYYRVKQTDVDGEFTYTPTLKVLMRATIGLTVYPTPFRESFTVMSPHKQTARLITMDGKLVRIVALKKGSNYVDASGLLKGLYILSSENNGIQKLLKE